MTTTAKPTERGLLRKQRIDEDPPKCGYCGRVIPRPRRYTPGVKYCTDGHSSKVALANHKQKKDKKKAKEAADKFDESTVRRGPVLDRVRSALTKPQFDAWINTELSNRKVAEIKGVEASFQAVGLARKAAWNDQIDAKAAKVFSVSSKHRKLLGPSDQTMRDLLVKEPEVFDQTLILLVDAFVEWRDEFFQQQLGQSYITKEVHKRWIRAVLNSIYTGGRLLILSPPRHGKTDLLIHFSVWLICRNPDIRILWVGPNSDIAELALGQVRNVLETHQDLSEAYLPLGDTWAPVKGGSSPTIWQSTRFTVANRSFHQKQPTMWCAGVAAKILSIDADFIVVDDPADPDASYTVGGRAKIENWFKTKLISRKMDRTGLTMISSRVHPEDLYSLFLENHNWDVLIDRAHNQAICGLSLWEKHTDDQACILFPEINPLRYLREQAEDVGESLFEMMYLNQPRPDTALIFDPDIIRDKCLDFSRDLGTHEIPGSYRLVAGLDPAARGVQAAFLWAVKLPIITGNAAADVASARDGSAGSETYHMVDLETQKAGGMEGALRVMGDWHEKYGVTLWVVEDNSYHQGVNAFGDPRLKELVADLGLDIRPTHTGKNKNDPHFGVAGMASLFHEGKITLPYHSMEARRKTDAYIRQLVNFTDDATIQRRTTSDILMAAWFPHSTVIKKWRREERQGRVSQVSDVSFPGYSQLDRNVLPWNPTGYPGV